MSSVPAVGLWLVTRHDDVKHVAGDPETFTAATDPSTLNRTMGENMLGMEGPEQRWIRAITEVPFRPRDVEERTQGMIPRLAAELLDGLVERGEADLFREYADPMSVRSLCFMLGLDDGAVAGHPALERGPDARPRELRGRSREAGARRRGGRLRCTPRSATCSTGSPTSPTGRCSRGCCTTNETAAA